MRGGIVLVLALSACGGGGATTDDRAACEALQAAEGDEAVYEELRGMNLSTELRTALDHLEAVSTSEPSSLKVLKDASRVAKLCQDQGVTLQARRFLSGG
ncbi:MAG: hypothetical protein KY454_12845 [Actinobacteria bacterium]|nr:hypothetical protein [Actinomycetota bacterium]